MSIKRSKITVIATKNNKETTIHSCMWDGDLGEWMEIGGEFAGALESLEGYDKVTITSDKLK